MSKKTKNAASEKRRKEKRSRKLAQQMKYAAWSAEGNNRKSKRNTLKSKRNVGVRSLRHQSVFCGNQGCRKCYPSLNSGVKIDYSIRTLIISKKTNGFNFKLV